MAAKKKDKKERDAADTHSLPDHTKEQLDLPLKGSPDLTGQSKEQLISKLQDLQIHLEMQAEELRRSHLALEVSRDKYLDLYDFAPLGYLTLNDNALITDVNLTGAMLLGAERNEIINHRFEQFIAPEDFERWYQFFANIQRQHVKKQVCTFVFIRENGSTFPAQLEGVRTISSDGAIEIHIAISDITDIREAEKALRESEEKYRVIFEKSVNGLFKITHEGALIAVNDAFARIYDYSSAAEMTADNQTRENLYISRSLYANPEDRKEIYRILAEKGKVENFETLHCKRDGTRIWISITARVVRDPEGTILFIEGTVIDITKRKQAEDALRESHDRFKATIASLDDAIFLVDPVTRLIIECNDASTRIFGCSREELIGKGTGFLHVDQAHLEQFSREVNATYKEPGFYTREFEMRRKNGDVFPTEHFVRPIHDPNGRILYVVSVVRDISGRKQAEEALRESESFNRGLVENLPDYIIVYRPDGKILYANPATVKGFGYNLNELVGTSVISYVAPECRTRVTAAIATRFKGDDPPEYETVLITKEGQRKTVIAKGTLVRYHDGLATLLLLTDITERKVAEEALQTLNAYNRNLLEASLDSLVTINSEGKIADVNASTEKITGCSREELIGTDFSDYFTEPEQAKRGYQRVFADGTVRNYPLNIRNRDGHITPVLYNATVYRDDKGDITGVFAAARDITERKRTEEALREGEERFRGLIDTITSGVAIYEVRNNGASGKDYIIKDFNKTALEIEGENKEDVIGKSLFDLRPTIDEYGLIQVFQHVWETGVPAYFPQKVYIDEKYSRWYENRVFRLQSGEIVAIYDDITELKQAEEALRESHDRFEATIASLDEAIFLVDPVTRLIIECNDASTRIFGCSREELIGKGTGFLHV
ncbi:MAG: PAS domain S-box protein, partial [Methanoregula sp.]|nr:PAS domain S-box protein [Methanoregula sp.]